jgi:GABA(A) receptor-associated protein
MVYQFDIKTKQTAEELKETFTSVMKKFPDRIPIILEKNRDSTSIQSIRKKKFLVPRDITISHFQYIIRKRIKLKSEEAIFLFTDTNDLVTGNTLMSQIYNTYKDESGFLFLLYSAEETFGC